MQYVVTSSADAGADGQCEHFNENTAETDHVVFRAIEMFWDFDGLGLPDFRAAKSNTASARRWIILMQMRITRLGAV